MVNNGHKKAPTDINIKLDIRWTPLPENETQASARFLPACFAEKQSNTHTNFQRLLFLLRKSFQKCDTAEMTSAAGVHDAPVMRS
ncbi:MAG: hypothetical protein ACJAXR_000536 [Halopseudomonas sp.]|jgi:hypothetical protein